MGLVFLDVAPGRLAVFAVWNHVVFLHFLLFYSTNWWGCPI